jgi:hypothetical protein
MRATIDAAVMPIAPKTAMCSYVMWLALVLGSSASGAVDAGAAPFELVRGGASTATIVLAEHPTRSASMAAAELQYHIRRITKATLPIVDDRQTIAGNRVLVGESRATLSFGLNNDDFGHQEYLIRSLPNALILMGRDRDDRGKFDYDDAETFPNQFDEQGTCYAVYDFLERCAQVRWYLPTELGLCCPAVKTLQVSGVEVRRSPAMKYRDAGFSYCSFPADLCGDTVNGPNRPPEMSLREHRIFAMRHRLGGMPYVATHSLEGYYDRFWKDAEAEPSAAFEAFHPEYFAQGYPGKPPQMCYTNPGLIEQVVQDARNYFDGRGGKSHPSAAGDFFSVVPMDNSQFCKCQNCRERLKGAAKRGDGQFSNDLASDYLFAFVNEVARKVRKSHPRKYISTLAYNCFAYPPSAFTLECNVSVQPCLIARNIFSPEIQRNDRAILDAWAAESAERPRMLWLYYCFPSMVAAYPSLLSSGDEPQFRCFPGFFAHAIVKQMGDYRKAGIRGIFYEPAYMAHMQRSALMDQLEFYVTWKLADDPDRDGHALIEEFFDRYYGSAATPMKAFYELVEQTYADPANYPPTFKIAAKLHDGEIVLANHQTEEAAWRHLGTEARMARLGRLMDEARTAARTEQEKQRVCLFDRGIWQYMQAGRSAWLRENGKKVSF